MIILGIDPGLQVCGYAVVKSENPGSELAEAGIFRTDSSKELPDRLVQLEKDCKSILERFQPDIVAVEQLYSHYKHPRTAILMGHARGVILLAAAAAGARIRDFSATRIKKSLTGNGRASKSQMQLSIQSVLHLARIPEPADVADAIAVALCCVNDNRGY